MNMTHWILQGALVASVVLLVAVFVLAPACAGNKLSTRSCSAMFWCLLGLLGCFVVAIVALLVGGAL